MQVRKELNEDKTTKHQNWKDAAKAVCRGKFITSNAFLMWKDQQDICIVYDRYSRGQGLPSCQSTNLTPHSVSMASGWHSRTIPAQTVHLGFSLPKPQECLPCARAGFPRLTARGQSSRWGACLPKVSTSRARPPAQLRASEGTRL